MYQVETRDVEIQRQGSTLARLYLPQGPGPFAMLVDVHGGGWTSGDRLNNATLNHAIASQGVVVVALDFRMPPVGRYLETVADVNFGIRWAKAHAREFASRAEWVGGLGTSSGGHLLMLNVLRPRDARYSAIPLAGSAVDASLAFAIACWPVVDPFARYKFVQETKNERLQAAHHAFWKDEAEMAEGSPHLILERGEKVSLPPLLTMQGTKDSNLPLGMAERFAAAYRKAGGQAEHAEFPGEPHAFVINTPDSAAARDATALMNRFIASQAARLGVK